MFLIYEINTFIQKGCIKIKSDSKTFRMLQKISIWNKCCTFQIYIHNKNIKQHICFQYW